MADKALLRITNTDDFANLAKRMRGADADIRREFYKGINHATKPIKTKARATAAVRLPHRGGLAAAVARSKFSTRQAAGGRNVGVRIVAKGTATRTTDKGHVEHPVFGRKPWVSQTVPGGWWTDTMRRSAPFVRRDLLKAMNVVAIKLTKG